MEGRPDSRDLQVRGKNLSNTIFADSTTTLDQRAPLTLDYNLEYFFVFNFEFIITTHLV